MIRYAAHHKPNIRASNVALLHISSRYANFQAVQELLRIANKEVVARCDSEGRLPLHWATVGFKGSVPEEYVLEKDE
jgi:hypothetical protein